MGMQFLSLMYTFNVAVDGVFNEHMCGNDEECLFGALIGKNYKLELPISQGLQYANPFK